MEPTQNRNTTYWNPEIKKLLPVSFTPAVINITGWKNPYSIFYSFDKFRRLKTLPLTNYCAPIASLTYNFLF